MIKLNDEGNRSKLKYGQYSLDLARPPIFLDDYENQEKIHIQVKISVVRAGGGIDMANPNADSDLLKKKSPSEKYYDPNFYKARSGSDVGSGKGREEGREKIGRERKRGKKVGEGRTKMRRGEIEGGK